MHMSFKNGLIDLRSDTVTHPTQEMRVAMANADVGDDVFGDDFTVIRLEEMASELTGCQAGLFMASGTMANLVALLTHCGRGTEAIVGNKSHIFLHEVVGMAALGGIQANQLPNQPDGTLRLEEIAAAIREDDVHHPRTGLVCLENTQNACGGVALSAGYTRSVVDLARRRGLKVHLDGTRLANAAEADSVMICLSKGFCAPIGSILCGTEDFIAEARRNRKQVGGGMRQVGVVAAAGIVALKTAIQRLEEDHANARRLADGLRNIPGIVLETETPQTNMVYFHMAPTAAVCVSELVDRLHKRGILEGSCLVTHYWVTAKDIAKVVAAFAEVMKN
jgi:threonine aldolase